MSFPDARLDGNALAAALSRVFVPDMTLATGLCGSCHHPSPLAEAAVYLQAPGSVMRCPSCGEPTLILSATPAHTLLTLPHDTTFRLPGV
ncbi:hypothetical protein EDD29_0268 [Actinocorallia herbida]|uniref:Uncharacterized protein n=1 Tax=Actinocorallia herbida TaxID=58109 RepID=A0A3N1CNP6_9ACTN|nr:DUF6510 family protein [Actinocorallia herbida]ROO82784.1 hypothetical protein EDD29_0268 [Actinocorallia herbida]